MTVKNETWANLCKIAQLLEEGNGLVACDLWQANSFAYSVFLEDNARALYDKYPSSETKEGSVAVGMMAMSDNFDFALEVFGSKKEQCAEYLTKKAQKYKFYESLLEFSKIVL